VCNVVSQSTTPTQSTITPTTQRDQLVDFAVSGDGVLVALYNDAESAVIKIKDVSGDDPPPDWHLNIRLQVMAGTLL